MRRQLCIAVLVLSLVEIGVFTSVPARADESTDATTAAEGMLPMGPPPEIQQQGYLVGTWDVASQMRMDPDSAYTPFPGVATYSYVAGGSCLEMNFTAEFLGMPFVGVGHSAYNRDTGEWVETWVDNLGGYMSVYRGKMADGKKVLRGQDYMAGEVWESRITISDSTPTHFNWQLEHSRDGGKTWAVYLKSVYTKRAE